MTWTCRFCGRHNHNDGITCMECGRKDEPSGGGTPEAALAVCSECGRKTWSPSEVRTWCDMPQPNGSRCNGFMVPPEAAAPDTEEMEVNHRCRFCGYEHWGLAELDPGYQVICMKCFARGPEKLTKEEAYVAYDPPPQSSRESQPQDRGERGDSGNTLGENKGEISDGYHTFNELYEHRHALFIALMQVVPGLSWFSLSHHDGSEFEGWFIAGICLPTGDISYHLPIHLWDRVRKSGAPILPRAPKWDGHTSQDVIDRLNAWRVPSPESSASTQPQEGRASASAELPNDFKKLVEMLRSCVPKVEQKEK